MSSYTLIPGRSLDDVVVPSLPGYGFSDRPSARGMDPKKIAELWARLMQELGYVRFGAQGGDWGLRFRLRLDSIMQSAWLGFT